MGDTGRSLRHNGEGSGGGERGQRDPLRASGTRMTDRELQIYCTPVSGLTYNNMAVRMGYDATLPGEKKPGHPIHGSIPRL